MNRSFLMRTAAVSSQQLRTVVHVPSLDHHKPSQPQGRNAVARERAMISAARYTSQSPKKRIDVSIRPACADDVPKLHSIIQAGTFSHHWTYKQTLCSNRASKNDCITAGYRGTESWTTEHHLVTGERISKAGLLDLITGQRDKLLVACTAAPAQDGETDKSSCTIVGCICAEWAQHHDNLELPDDNAMLGLFAVDPAFQSRGVGGALIAYAEDYVKSEWQCRRIVLWVIEQRGDIMRWYERCGFVVTDERLPFVFPDKALVDSMQFCVLVKDL